MKFELGTDNEIYTYEVYNCPKHGEVSGGDVIHIHLRGEVFSYCGVCLNSFLFDEIYLLYHREEE